ncbi:peptidoglycan recognition protein family protein [Streptomyces aidingensis]|uniref:N-acetylmuramoyl-L-alanine amidase n=1 Tax=Streptomyces aidingensis TaxID=910347 RepID=A0A1I1GRB7_9ACTN|nr:peptidoglycan recognition protein [Streptomyces aidingensis]SFC11783.1 N-acetylmuramoyl-L-alanine amidase [Streptomyces aidingensis]
MRALVISALRAFCGTVCGAALVVCTGPAAAIARAHPPPPAEAGQEAGARPGAAGSVRALPLRPRAAAGPVTETGPFSLLGIVWPDAGQELRAEAWVRTRSAATGEWSGWHRLEGHPDHGPDHAVGHESGHESGHGAAERAAEAVRGGTAPLWTGPSDAVQVRLAAAPGLPHGLRLALVDPGEGPAPAGTAAGAPQPRGAAAPMPQITSRAGWNADESRREAEFVYTESVKTVFVHHTETGNGYDCAEAPAVVRSIYRYHTEGLGWRDIGYNFLVDKCGTLYEGRAGGVDLPVRGAHTLGFNHNSAGVAVIGTFMDQEVPPPAADAVARLAAWKLRMYGGDPAGTRERTSTGGKYPAGTVVRLHTVSGHRDGTHTDCPGDRLYAQLPAIRTAAAAIRRPAAGR